MMYAVNATIDNLIDALGNFIALFVAGAPVIRGQVNRTPPPAAPFVELTELFENGLSFPRTDYDPAEDKAVITDPTRFDIQADFYGEQAGDYCKAVKQAIRTGWGFDRFPANIKPLFTDGGREAPLATGEQQHLRRWALTVSLQYNPAVEVPQEFAEAAAPNELIPADVIYQP